MFISADNIDNDWRRHVLQPVREAVHPAPVPRRALRYCGPSLRYHARAGGGPQSGDAAGGLLFEADDQEWPGGYLEVTGQFVHEKKIK